jgi:ElaB/YqjD/DUF883 family membrane-anchored ribosome-binding protein
MANESTAESKARRNAAAGGEDSLEAQIETLKADLAAVRASLAELLKTGARQGRAKAERASEDYLKQGQERADAAMESARAFGEELQGQITKNPIAAVLIALGLGYFIGSLGRR